MEFQEDADLKALLEDSDQGDDAIFSKEELEEISKLSTICRRKRKVDDHLKRLEQVNSDLQIELERSKLLEDGMIRQHENPLVSAARKHPWLKPQEHCLEIDIQQFKIPSQSNSFTHFEGELSSGSMQNLTKILAECDDVESAEVGTALLLIGESPLSIIRVLLNLCATSDDSSVVLNSHLLILQQILHGSHPGTPCDYISFMGILLDEPVDPVLKIDLQLVQMFLSYWRLLKNSINCFFMAKIWSFLMRNSLPEERILIPLMSIIPDMLNTHSLSEEIKVLIENCFRQIGKKLTSALLQHFCILIAQTCISLPEKLLLIENMSKDVKNFFSSIALKWLFHHINPSFSEFTGKETVSTLKKLGPDYENSDLALLWTLLLSLHLFWSSDANAKKDIETYSLLLYEFSFVRKRLKKGLFAVQQFDKVWEELDVIMHFDYSLLQL